MNIYRHNQSERGQAIVLLVFGMIVLLGMAGLAIDGGNVYTQRRRAQSAVDNAALAFALSLNQASGNGLTQANTVLANNGYVDGQNDTFVAINHPPAGYDSSYVEVVLTQTVPTALIHLAYSGPVVYTVRAIARGQSGTAPMAGFAVVGMADCLASGGNDLEVTGGGTSGGINVHGGNIFANTPESASNHCAIKPPNNGTGITVDSGYTITSVGSYDYAGTLMMTTPVQTNANGGVPITDPLASLPEPTCTGNGPVNTGPDPDEYYPGYFGGAGQPSIGWGHYNPGIYCITGGINPGGDGAITGDGVLFYLMTGGITLSGNQGMSITGPTTLNCLGTYGQASASCTYVGMTIFAARGNTSTIDVRGNGGTAVTGTIYALDGTVRAMGGGSDPNGYETSVVGQVIGARVLGNGNGSFNVTYNDSVVYHKPPSIQLVK